jgi:hypothetical protein
MKYTFVSTVDSRYQITVQYVKNSFVSFEVDFPITLNEDAFDRLKNTLHPHNVDITSNRLVGLKFMLKTNTEKVEITGKIFNRYIKLTQTYTFAVYFLFHSTS